MQEIQIVLPARLASTRLPEKLLRRVAGKTILHHTYEAASRSKLVTREVIVAVDDDRLADEVDSFGGRWIMTPKDCASGTDRIGFVAAELSQTEYFINVQGDEPEIDPAAIDAVAEAILADPSADIATAGTPIRDAALLADPAVVKIVMADVGGAGQGRAVYFSRASVPFDRDGNGQSQLSAEPPVYWHHIGLYAYRRDFLEWFSRTPPSVLESVERLEQLRAIEAGKRVVVARVNAAMPGIDTEADLAAYRRRIENGV